MAEEKKNPLIGAFRTPPPVKPPTEPVKPAIPQKITPPSVGGPLKATADNKTVPPIVTPTDEKKSAEKKPSEQVVPTAQENKVDKSKAVTPEKAEDKSKATTPEKPDDKSKTATPEKPDDKGKAATPEKSEDKGKAITPEKLDDKGKAITPEKPDDKAKVVAPEKPDNKGKTATLEKPDDKGKTATPEKPDDKAKPATPEKPDDKGKAVAPEKSDDKGKAVAPEKSDDKGKAVAPEKPDNKGKSTVSEKPAAQDKSNDKDKPTAPEKKDDKSKADAVEPNSSDTIPDDFKLDIVPQGGITEVVMLPLSQIDDFENHPFPVVDDKEMDELVESVKRFGVLEATTVIPSEKAPGRYEMVAGHRRKHACLLAGKTEVPAIIRHMDRDTAILYMIDTNLKRKDLTPMQKARIYVMKLEAMKRKNGRPTKEDIAAGRVPMREDGVTPMRADEQLAKETGESRATIQRLTRLTKLEPELQEMVDKKVLPVNTAADISFLKKDEQKTLANAIQKEDKIPSGTQAAELKKASQAGSLTPEKIERTVAPTKREEIPPLKVTFSEEELRPYFPNKRTTLPDVKLAVFEGLKMRQMAIERKAQAAAKSTPDKKAPTR